MVVEEASGDMSAKGSVDVSQENCLKGWTITIDVVGGRRLCLFAERAE